MEFMAIGAVVIQFVSDIAAGAVGAVAAEIVLTAFKKSF